jgi:Protein of unknown function (DUF2568)
MSALERIVLTLRVLIEVGIVGALAYWGLRSGDTTVGKIVLGVGAPVVGFGFWGAVDFRRAGRLAEPLRLIQELAVSGVAAFALYAAGQQALGVVLGVLSIAYHALVYLSGGRLLKPRPPVSSGVAAGHRTSSVGR